MTYWFTKSTKEILIDHMKIENPSVELIKIMDDLVEKYVTDAWYMVYNYTEKEIKFIYNNFPAGMFYKKILMKYFFELTDGNPNQKQIALKWKGEGKLEDIVNEYKIDSFDLSLLDPLEGKITEEKMINWGVGQIMKQFPKKYSPMEIRQAIEKRFFNK